MGQVAGGRGGAARRRAPCPPTPARRPPCSSHASPAVGAGPRALGRTRAGGQADRPGLAAARPRRRRPCGGRRVRRTERPATTALGRRGPCTAPVGRRGARAGRPAPRRHCPRGRGRLGGRHAPDTGTTTALPLGPGSPAGHPGHCSGVCAKRDVEQRCPWCRCVGPGKGREESHYGRRPALIGSSGPLSCRRLDVLHQAPPGALQRSSRHTRTHSHMHLEVPAQQRSCQQHSCEPLSDASMGPMVLPAGEWTLLLAPACPTSREPSCQSRTGTDNGGAQQAGRTAGARPVPAGAHSWVGEWARQLNSGSTHMASDSSLATPSAPPRAARP